MARKTKCPACSLFFDRDIMPYVHHKNRYYHEDCYNKNLSLEQKQLVEKAELEKYICELFNIKEITPRIMKQMNDYVKINGFTYKGIQLTLYYFFELKGNPLSKSNGAIGIVPFVYSDAKEFFQKKAQAEETNKKIITKLNNILLEYKTVKIKPPSLRQEQKEKDRKVRIDVSLL